MGWPVGEVFVPQVHEPGVGAEVDWGEAEVELAGRAHDGSSVLHARRRSRGRRSVRRSLVETQQAFLELHVEAFEWFGGVFAQIRYDNLTSAVKQVLKGRRRVESDRFVALRSHYLFDVGVHEAGDRGRAREGRCRGRGRPLPPQPSRPGAGGRDAGRAERVAARAAAKPTCAGGSSGVR